MAGVASWLFVTSAIAAVNDCKQTGLQGEVNSYFCGEEQGCTYDQKSADNQAAITCLNWRPKCEDILDTKNDPFEKGYVYGYEQTDLDQSHRLKMSDYCQRDDLYQVECSGDNTAFFRKTHCAVGCRDGACIEGETVDDLAEECTDSDSGKIYYEFGIVHQEEIQKDLCIDQRTIKEWYCSSDYSESSVTYTCPFGCQNARCSVPTITIAAVQYEEGTLTVQLEKATSKAVDIQYEVREQGSSKTLTEGSMFTLEQTVQTNTIQSALNALKKPEGLFELHIAVCAPNTNSRYPVLDTRICGNKSIHTFTYLPSIQTEEVEQGVMREETPDEQQTKDEPMTNPDVPSLPSAQPSDDVLSNYTIYANPFPDTEMGYINGYSAAELYRRGAVQGFPDGTFGGEFLVNRAQALKMLLLVKHGTTTGLPQSPVEFSDVENNAWYTSYVQIAVEQGIVDGYPDGSFQPARQVNTVEFLKMLVETFHLPTRKTYIYKDVPYEAWFNVYASAAEQYTLFPLRTKNLQPNQPLTRTEVAVAIYQYLVSR